MGTFTTNGAATFVGTVSGGDDGPATINLATYSVDINGAMSDSLVIGGALDLTNSFDQITFQGSPDGTSSYLLATFAWLDGTFDFGSPPSGYQIIYGTNELILASVPEPSIVSLGGFGAAAIFLARRLRRTL